MQKLKRSSLVAFLEKNMNGAELVGLVVSAGLLVYLVIALLKPEWFA